MMALLSPIGAACPSTPVICRSAVAQVRDLALMMAVAAMPPGRAGRGLQPAIDDSVPDVDPTAVAPPVLLVHGFAGRTSWWFALARALRARGVTVDAMSYSSFGTSVEHLAERLVAEVATLRSETGAGKVHLVGHSLGGVVIALALADGRLAGQVDTVVTIAAPFDGSPWAKLLPLSATIRALRNGSAVLRRLADAPPPQGVRWLAFAATLDMIVPGRRSVPAHTDVQTVLVDDVGHFGLLMSQQVLDRIVAVLQVNERALA
jgi:triacylglycerol lipase